MILWRTPDGIKDSLMRFIEVTIHMDQKYFAIIVFGFGIRIQRRFDDSSNTIR